MAKEHLENLRHLRDELVEERRQMVAEAFADPEARHEAAADFIGLQHLIDVVERAMAHEASLERFPKASSGTVGGGPRS
ncbi:MAG TPA: hypothetical protein VJ770_02865 [Stellaceae bacterium]|nr:hypothetical protein [Stellaceae bacterium]